MTELQIERLTPSVKRVLSMAQAEADRDKDLYVGVNHICVGMALEGKNFGACIFEQHNISLNELRLEPENQVKTAAPLMITKSEGYQTPDGEMFSTLEKAQNHFLESVIRTGLSQHANLQPESYAYNPSWVTVSAGSILAQKQAIIDCLTAK